MKRAIIGMFAFVWLGTSCQASKEAAAIDSGSPNATVPISVDVVPVVRQKVAYSLPLTGTLYAETRTELTANATGRVIQTFVEPGQKVEQGAVLARLDIRSAAAAQREAKAQADSAKHQLNFAQAECARYDALAKRGAITAQEHERQAATCLEQVAAAQRFEAHAQNASLTVADGTIRAPFAGTVTERLVSVGDYVQAASKVVTLVVSERLRLRVAVPERHLDQVRIGSPLTFRRAADSERVFNAAVSRLSGEVRGESRDFLIEADVDNASASLLPGMFVTLDLVLGERETPVIPLSSLRQEGETSSVFVLDQGHLIATPVQPGPQEKDLVAILDGLSAGALVVTHPTPIMRDGDSANAK